VASAFETVTGGRAALRDLSDRGLVRVTGADRVRFLNGMLSNDVAKLAAGDACASLLLDRKGHVLADLWVLAEPDAILLDVAPGHEAELASVLEKHIIADDVALASLSHESGQLGLEGPGARDAGDWRGSGASAERAELLGRVALRRLGRQPLGDGLRVFAPRALTCAARCARAARLRPKTPRCCGSRPRSRSSAAT
jgi:folate-binding Fe-S cluster repair protein YgfZ